MLEEKEKEGINQDRKRYMGQIESEDLANHSIKRSKSSSTSVSFANGLFDKSRIWKEESEAPARIDNKGLET